MKLVIAATGASGAIYLQRLLTQIDCAANEVHLIMSAHADQVAKQELEDFKVPSNVSQHSENDMDVPFVSGSARFDAMVIVPCSMATLGRIASGCSDSALLRAVDVFLKERRKLIVVPRETPWNLIHARNVVTLLEAGAIVLPAIPSFYSRPGSVTAVVDTVVWRILDQIGLPSPSHVSLGRKQRSGETQEKLKIEGWLARWLIAFGSWSLRLWARTLRYEVDDQSGVVGEPVTENYIGALWHNRLLIFPLVLRRFLPNRHGAALISASRDGDLLADVIHRFGYDVVRGSSSRLGASAILQLTECWPHVAMW